MKVVLVRPNFDSHIITPPIGLGYLASALKIFEINVVIIDALKNNFSNIALVGIIEKQNPDIVGITCLTAFYNETIELSLLLKQKNIKVVIGGVHPTFLPHQTLLESNCDYVILGEGEIALRKLVQNNGLNNNIQGVYSKYDFEKIDFKPIKAEIVQNLDDIPFPDWEQINPSDYKFAPHGAIVKNFPIGVLMSTRGCPYECTFCASPKFYDRKIRFRSPENVVAEIKLLVNNFGVKEIHFEDDNITLKRSHIEQICNLIITEKIKISWACPNGIRADKVDESLIKLMKKSGCYYFAYGIESTNQQILNSIKKDENINNIKKSIETADKIGISCQGFFILGLPGETCETLEDTIRFAKKSKLSRAQFSILDVLPGSELWDNLKAEFTPDWRKKSFKEPEWLPQGISKQELIDAQPKAFREFYLKSPTRLIKLLRYFKIRQLKYLLRRLKDYRITKK
ncbi:MAG: hypothetical protein A2033_02010 [Bacteroidetes bacterium GWA2_31_9]|nr:MAG: hypothetical protein A2033_02010 [Bacteroidetes bacterium GWA2_31_9]